jgi:hypothetical protein
LQVLTSPSTTISNSAILAKRFQVPFSAIPEGWETNAETATCSRIENGRAVRTRIRLGRNQNQRRRVEVLDGLKEGDRVLAHPNHEIINGQMIESRLVKDAERNESPEEWGDTATRQGIARCRERRRSDANGPPGMKPGGPLL